MPELPDPMEALELQDGQSARFRVLRYEVGEKTIKPDHAPTGKLIRIVRVHVPKEDKPGFPHYWDVTSARLVAQLLPFLESPDFARKTYTVTARGIPPKKYFNLEVALS